MTHGTKPAPSWPPYFQGVVLALALSAGCQKAAPADVPPLPQQPQQLAPQVPGAPDIEARGPSAREPGVEVPVPSDQTHTGRARFDLGAEVIAADARDGEAIRTALEQRITELQDERRERMLNSIRNAQIVINEDSMAIGRWGLQVHGSQLRLLHRTGPGDAPAYGAEVSKTTKGWEVGPVEPVFIHAQR